jgi:hypothetical protein
MEVNDFPKELKAMTKAHGHRVDMKTRYCDWRQKIGVGCPTCSSEKGCRVYTDVMMVTARVALMKPKDEEERQAIWRAGLDVIRRILKGEGTIDGIDKFYSGD